LFGSGDRKGSPYGDVTIMVGATLAVARTINTPNQPLLN
jgi:hypothetical protein